MATRFDRAKIAARATCWGALMVLASLVQAQEVGRAPARGWFVSPRVSMAETYTDNVAQASTNPRSDFVTEVTPGIRVDANTSSLKAHLDYGLSEVFYARDSSPRRTTQSLSAGGTFEAIDDHAFLDFSGNISQQRVSAFRPEVLASSSLSGNTTKATTTSISPYVRGRLGTFADVLVRYAATAERADNASLGDIKTERWTTALSGASPSSRLLWNLTGSLQETEYAGREPSESRAANLRLTYVADVDYRFWASGGRDSNNYAGLGTTAYSTWGGGVDWTPGPRTAVSLSRERHFFGDANNVSISHRLPNTLFRLSHGKSVSVTPNQPASMSVRTNFDYYYALLEPLYPDPFLRAAATVLELNSRRLPPNGPHFDLFLVQRVSVQSRSEVAAVFQGRTNTITLTGARIRSQSLLSGTFGDDFDGNSEVRQSSVGVSWVSQLSPATAASGSLVRSTSRGDDTSGLSSTARTASLGLQRSLGRATALSLSFSRTESEGASSAYTANSISASVSHTF